MEKTFNGAEFEWDKHNVDKNWKKHKVKFTECEEIFFDAKLKVMPDEGHSSDEERYLALGETKEKRPLFVAFTERLGKIRVISARNMSRKERRAYHEKNKEDAEP